MTRVEPWWVVDAGFVTEDDIKVINDTIERRSFL